MGWAGAAYSWAAYCWTGVMGYLKYGFLRHMTVQGSIFCLISKVGTSHLRLMSDVTKNRIFADIRVRWVEHFNGRLWVMG